MTFKQLTYFLQVAESGSFTKAAAVLNISQPPLSYAIKQLEEELGVSLFIRDSHNLKITSEGSYLQDKASQILSLVHTTEENLKNFSSTEAITINIGAVSSIVHNFLPTAIMTFYRRHPSVMVNIHDGSSIRIMELLNNGVIDLGILREPFNKEIYNHKKIILPYTRDGDYFVAVGKKEFFKDIQGPEIQFTDLLSLPLIIHRRFEESFMQVCSRLNTMPQIICKNDNITTSIEWAKNGFGVAHMPLSSSHLISDPNIQIKKIVNPVSYSNIYLIWNKSGKLPGSIREFIDCFD